MIRHCLTKVHHFVQLKPFNTNCLSFKGGKRTTSKSSYSFNSRQQRHSNESTRQTHRQPHEKSFTQRRLCFQHCQQHTIHTNKIKSNQRSQSTSNTPCHSTLHRGAVRTGNITVRGGTREKSIVAEQLVTSQLPDLDRFPLQRVQRAHKRH